MSLLRPRPSGMQRASSPFAYRDLIKDLAAKVTDTLAADGGGSWLMRYQNRVRYRQVVSEQLDKLFMEEQLVLSRVDRHKLQVTIFSEICGLGPLDSLLDDDSVNEIHVNGPKNVYIKQATGMQRSEVVFDDPAHILCIFERFTLLAGNYTQNVAGLKWVTLPDGTHITAVIDSVSVTGPLLTIVKSAEGRADNVLARFGLTKEALKLLIDAVQNRRNLVLCGTSGSGKTALLNVLAKSIPAADRVIVIERGREVNIDVTNDLRLTLSDETQLTAVDLLRYATTLAADRVIIGELEGDETALWIEAINRGCQGSIAVVLARDPEDALTQIMQQCAQTLQTSSTDETVREFVASALHLIVHQARMEDGSRRVARISEITPHGTLHDRFVFQVSSAADGVIQGMLHEA